MYVGQTANSAALVVATQIADRRDAVAEGALLPAESGRHAIEPSQTGPVLHGEFMGAGDRDRKSRGGIYSIPDAAKLINLGQTGSARVKAIYGLGGAQSGQLGRHIDVVV